MPGVQPSLTRVRTLLPGMAAAALVLAILPGVAWSAPGAGLAPASGPAGTRVTVTGSGFAVRTPVRVRAGAKTLTTAKTDGAGRFDAVVRIPAMKRPVLALLIDAGRTTVMTRFARGAAVPEWREWATAGGRRLRWTSGPLSAGETLRLRAEGLRKQERMTLTGVGAASRVRADRKGGLAASVVVPAGAAGVRTATLRGPGGALTFQFTVKAPASFTPQPPPFLPPPAPPSTDASKSGTLVVRQSTAPPVGTAFPFSGPESFALANGERRSFAVEPGSYLVRQIAVLGYELADLSCDDDDSKLDLAARSATAVVEAGETVTCTFTNTKHGTGTIRERSAPGSRFDFTGPGEAFSLGDGEDKVLDLPAGAHTVTQAAKDGYDLTGLSCDDPSGGSSTTWPPARPSQTSPPARPSPAPSPTPSGEPADRAGDRARRRPDPFSYSGAGPAFTLADGQTASSSCRRRRTSLPGSPRPATTSPASAATTRAAAPAPTWPPARPPSPSPPARPHLHLHRHQARHHRDRADHRPRRPRHLQLHRPQRQLPTRPRRHPAHRRRPRHPHHHPSPPARLRPHRHQLRQHGVDDGPRPADGHRRGGRGRDGPLHVQGRQARDPGDPSDHRPAEHHRVRLLSRFQEHHRRTRCPRVLRPSRGDAHGHPGRRRRLHAHGDRLRRRHRRRRAAHRRGRRTGRRHGEVRLHERPPGEDRHRQGDGRPLR